MFFRVATAFAGSFVVFAAPVHAQDSAAPAAVAEAAVATADNSAPVAVVPAAVAPVVAIAATAPALVLPAATEIILTPDAEANSKKLREGHSVPMHTMFDVMHNGAIVIPKGTRGMGTVTWRTGKGAFGKSAKMEITFNELVLPNGDKVALTGMHRQEGQGNTGAAVGAAVAVGVFGAFVTGKSAIIPTGQQLSARTAGPLAYALPAEAKIAPVAVPVPAAAAETTTAGTAPAATETADTPTTK